MFLSQFATKLLKKILEYITISFLIYSKLFQMAFRDLLVKNQNLDLFIWTSMNIPIVHNPKEWTISFNIILKW